MTRLGYAGFAVSSLLVALVSLRVVIWPIEVVMDHMAHFVADTPLRLWLHLTCGPLALALGPLQVWVGLRLRWPALHRLSGRVYGVAGLLLALESDASLFARAGFVVLAVLWVGCTLTGIRCAMQGDHARHLWWMQRSLALTFSAVTLRLIMAPLMASGWTVAQTYDVTAWGSWMLNLAVLEIMQRRSLQVI